MLNVAMMLCLLPDDEREHPPPAPLHSGKYQNDYVAVENEIYMAYGQVMFLETFAG